MGLHADVRYYLCVSWRLAHSTRRPLMKHVSPSVGCGFAPCRYEYLTGVGLPFGCLGLAICFYVSGAFYSSANDEACLPIRRLLIWARKIGISDRRWVCFRMFEICDAFLRVWRILFVGRCWGMSPRRMSVDFRQEDRDI